MADGMHFCSGSCRRGGGFLLNAEGPRIFYGAVHRSRRAQRVPNGFGTWRSPLAGPTDRFWRKADIRGRLFLTLGRRKKASAAVGRPRWRLGKAAGMDGRFRRGQSKRQLPSWLRQEVPVRVSSRPLR